MTADEEEAVFGSQRIFVPSHPGRVTKEVVAPLAADRRDRRSHRHAMVPVA